LRGWGYNAYALKESDEVGTKLTSLNVSCQDFVSESEKTATAYWISLDESSEKFLKNCGLKKIAGENPSLFFLDSKNISLVDGAQLLEFNNTKIKLRARAENVLVKVSWFPRWSAIDSTTGQKLSIQDAKPGMLLKVEPGTIVELDYGLTETDWSGIIISVVFVLLFLLALF
jgi:hypothetical protein